MRRLWFCSVLILASAGLLLSACEDDTNFQNAPTLIEIQEVEPSPDGFGDDECVFGGQRIFFGFDVNGNGRLDGIERERTFLVCDFGNPGEDGLDALIRTSSVARGDETCRQGGVLVESGFDLDRNGQLSNFEVDQSQLFCQGDVGLTLLFRTSLLEEGAHEDCPLSPAVLVERGLDDNENGVLDDPEVEGSQAVCYGDRGVPALTRTTAIEEGDETCPFGGVLLEYGPDWNRSDTLDDDEVENDQVLCTVPGLNALTEVRPVVDEHCPQGGLRVDFGLDDGDGGGTPHDLDLHPGEIDRTVYICNGDGGLPEAPVLIPDGPDRPGIIGAWGGDGCNGVGGNGGYFNAQIGGLPGGVEGDDTGLPGDKGDNGADEELMGSSLFGNIALHRGGSVDTYFPSPHLDPYLGPNPWVVHRDMDPIQCLGNEALEVLLGIQTTDADGRLIACMPHVHSHPGIGASNPPHIPGEVYINGTGVHEYLGVGPGGIGLFSTFTGLQVGHPDDLLPPAEGDDEGDGEESGDGADDGGTDAGDDSKGAAPGAFSDYMTLILPPNCSGLSVDRRNIGFNCGRGKGLNGINGTSAAVLSMVRGAYLLGDITTAPIVFTGESYALVGTIFKGHTDPIFFQVIDLGLHFTEVYQGPDSDILLPGAPGFLPDFLGTAQYLSIYETGGVHGGDLVILADQDVLPNSDNSFPHYGRFEGHGTVISPGGDGGGRSDVVGSNLFAGHGGSTTIYAGNGLYSWTEIYSPGGFGTNRGSVGGDGGGVHFEVGYGHLFNAGTWDSTGGDGEQGGEGGDHTLSLGPMFRNEGDDSSQGEIRNSGNLWGDGGWGIADDGGPGGNAIFRAYGGSIRNSGTLSRIGGSSQAANGGPGGSLDARYSQGDYGRDNSFIGDHIPNGHIQWSGDAYLWGGHGGLDEECLLGQDGGNGGNINFAIDARFVADGQSITLYGYGGPLGVPFPGDEGDAEEDGDSEEEKGVEDFSPGIILDGGFGGFSGGHGGPFNLLNDACLHTGSICDSSPESRIPGGTSGGIYNWVDLTSIGGDGDFAHGGDGGWVQMMTDDQSAFSFDYTRTENYGDMVLNGGFGGTTVRRFFPDMNLPVAFENQNPNFVGGHGGCVYIYGYRGAENHGIINSIGGDALDHGGGGFAGFTASNVRDLPDNSPPDDDPPLSIVPFPDYCQWGISILSTDGHTVNAGDILALGGTGAGLQQFGGFAPPVQLVGQSVENTASIATVGGDADKDLGIGGDGGQIFMLGTLDGTENTSEDLFFFGGDAALIGFLGGVWIDGQNLTFSFLPEP